MDDRTNDALDDDVELHDEPWDQEPIDLDSLDPEAWRPGIPWWPSFSLLVTLLALPLLSVLLIGPLGDELRSDAPDQLWAIGIWRVLITVALIGGAGLVLVVPIAARIARRRAGVVFGLLEVGFPIGVVLVALLILVHTGLAIALVLAIERIVLGTTFTASIVVVLIAGVVSATYLITSGLAALRPTPSDEPSIGLDRDRARGLYDLVGRLAARVGVAPPDALLLGPTMDFWTATGTFRVLDRTASGTVIQVSLPQLGLLSVAELEGVIAHELAHIRHGDTAIGARMGPAWDRMARSIDALDRESSGVGRIAAKPGLLWLEFAGNALGAAVAEHQRASEAAADRTAASIVGSGPVASGLLVGHALGSIHDTWVEDLEAALASGNGDPVATFVSNARPALDWLTTADVVERSLDDLGPSHPSLIERLRALGEVDRAFGLAEEGALASMLDDPPRTTRRLLDALRGPVAEREIVRLNEPRVTPGLVGWALTGIVFAGIFVVRGTQGSGLGRDGPVIVAIVGGLWLLFPFVYFWLQQEIRLGGGQVRARSWWWRWLDRSAGQRQWRRVRWSGSLRLSDGFEGLLTLTDGTDRLRWWSGTWSKRDLARLRQTLLDGGAQVELTSVGDALKDPERHAVVWYVAERFLVPRVKEGEDGSLIEVQPVSVYRAGMLRLSLSLVDRLDEPVERANPYDRFADPGYLAEAAKVDRETFDHEARRLTVDGDSETWIVREDGREDEWRADRSTDEADMTELIFEILGLPKSARGPRPKNAR